jgi:hypothetical protein
VSQGQHRLEEFLAALSREAGAEDLVAADADLLIRASTVLQELSVQAALGAPGSDVISSLAEYGASVGGSLLELRLSKAVDRVSERGIAPPSGLPEENFVSGLLEEAASRANLLKEAIQGGSPLAILAARWEASRDMVTVRAEHEVPAFRGVDLNSYGPLSPGDVAMIPREDARALISKGLVEEVVVL